MGELPRLLSRLNAETQPHYAEADRDLDLYLFKPNLTTRDYMTFLARALGFVAPLEAALARAPGLHEVLDVNPRMKSALIVHDLLALGMTMSEVHTLPQCAPPVLRGPAAALGWLYVVEREALLGGVLREHVATRLPTEMARASAYFTAYQGRAGKLWNELGLAMNLVASKQAIADRIVTSAHDGFRAQLRWRRDVYDRSAGHRFAG
jgi:heme oxygenase (biliverdin-IX-beta and delta-forming)